MRTLILIGLAACGTQEAVDRPHDVEYVTKTILAPNCGIAGCHSTFKQTDGLVFDTVEAVKIVTRFDLTRVDPMDPGPRLMGPGGREGQPIKSNLQSELPDLIPQMPLDGPMSGTDIDTLLDFFAAGAPGACTPEPDFCTTAASLVHACGADDNYVLEDCSVTCNDNSATCVDAMCVCP